MATIPPPVAAAHNNTSCKAPLALGLDFGTSGARACLVDPANRAPVALYRAPYASSTPAAWRDALSTLINTIQQQEHGEIGAMCVDGTSATTLLVDAPSGTLINDTCFLMYNQAAPDHAVQAAVQLAGDASTPATAPTSALPKLLTWILDGTVDAARDAGYAPVLCHQADWIAGLAWDMLVGGKQDVSIYTTSSYNNCLKLGYDVRQLQWPAWLLDDPRVAPLLPQHVVAPGEVVAVCEKGSTVLCAGTTDSIAAFLASGASQPGDAVTSLGSTLALKLISDEPIQDDPARGLYCHRLGDTWLVGGASSSGCAVLRERWTDEELVGLEQALLARSSTWSTGVEPPRKHVRLLPRGVTHDRLVGGSGWGGRDESGAHRDIDTLYAILHGIASIEAGAYKALHEAGATPVARCFTAGGGAKNEAWRQMRARMLGIPVTSLVEPYDEAAYGCALLAARRLF